MSPPLPRRHATEFIHGSRRQRALERSEPVGLMWIGHDRLLFSDSRARDASGPGRGYLHTAASRPLQLARRQAGLQVIRALLVPGTRPNSRRWCSLSFGARHAPSWLGRGAGRRRSPPGGSRCSLHGLLRPLLLFLRLSTAGSTAACASGASPPMVASLSAAGAQALKRRRQLQLHVHAVQRARRRLLKVALRSCDALPRRTAGTAKRHELVGCSGPNAVAAKPYQMRQRRRRGR